jgi:hypothetical protein
MDFFLEDDRAHTLREYIYSVAWKCNNLDELSIKYFLSGLRSSERRMLCNAMPLFAEKFKQYNKIIDIIVEMIIILSENKATSQADCEKKYSSVLTTSQVRVYIVLANYFVTSVLPNHMDTSRLFINKSLIRDVIFTCDIKLFIKLFKTQ